MFLGKSTFCLTQVVIPQDQSNLEDEISQKFKDLKSNLKSELDLFKTQICGCIRNVHTNMKSKISETEKQLSSKHQVTTIKLKKLKLKTN